MLVNIGPYLGDENRIASDRSISAVRRELTMIVRWPKMVRPASGLLLFCALLAVWFDLSDGWRYDRVPRLYGDKVPTKAISPRLRKVQRRIVMLHDSYRTKVVPPAANMLNMVSNVGLRGNVWSCVYVWILGWVKQTGDQDGLIGIGPAENEGRESVGNDFLSPECLLR
uniref:Uncharacterized protein n=1 Tax=Anopheles melas TaxID=34690 RepID=A0A182U737_9DIPT